MQLKILNKSLKKQIKSVFRLVRPFFGFFLLGVLFSGCIPQTQYSPQANLSVSGKFRAIAVSDLDNDGLTDVIGGSDIPGTVVIWYGDGAGNLADPFFLPMRAAVRSIAVADIDEDGRKDLVVSVQGEASGIMVWQNRAKDDWVQATGPIEINAYEGIRTADINKDGHMDIVAANFTSELLGGIQVWQGDGNGGWSGDKGPTINGMFMDVAVADLNEDGWLDLIGAGWGTMGALRLWYGTPHGGWIAGPVLENGNFNRLSVADINGDGNMDILAGTYRSGIRIWTGNGGEEFEKHDAPIQDGSYWKVLPVDLNGDGRLDLVAGSTENQGIKAVENRGRGGWGNLDLRFPNVGAYFDMAASDLNGDDVTDIVLASYGEGVKVNLRGAKTLAKTGSLVPSQTQKGISGDAVIRENAVFKDLDGVPEYKIGPGDTLEIKLWKGIEATTFTMIVRPEGKISFGLLENLTVAGLTARELDALITEQLQEYIKAPRVDVLVTDHQSKFVKILGPGYGYADRSGAGRVPLKGKTTLLEAISERGGLHKNANLSRVRVQRKNGQALTVDLYKAITLGDTAQDVVLDAGDLIYIPIVTEAENRIYVFGEVGSPGAQSFTGTEIRLLDVVMKAGGLTPFSTPESTKIVRGDPTHPLVLSVDLERLMKEGDLTQNIALANGDFVFIPRSFIGDINAFLQQVEPILRLLYTPSFILDVPRETRDSYQDAEEALGVQSRDGE